MNSSACAARFGFVFVSVYILFVPAVGIDLERDSLIGSIHSVPTGFSPLYKEQM